ncbi:hypothetical protein BD779DRAFT_20980 [Infundibulicybe gibba]|nr:hypothetical protein BD779DRAFT_20980 [Infundibulicybe gibba]
MDVGLPRETQQIDRVIEAFAARYLQCNPRLFTSEDHPYILAFSLIMLHTDAFNKSNKRKMSKADYIKNTRLPGVAPEVLDCFYDNIVFAPFIFIEDPLDVNGQRGVLSEQNSSRVLSSYSLNSIPNSANGTPGRGNKVDPYYLITNKLLDPLRVDIAAHLPLENPYSYEGTSGPWDESELQHVFAKASEIEVGTSNSTRTSIFGLNTTSGPPSPLAKLGSTPNQDYLSSGSDPWTLRVTKVGLLNRKDDVLEGGRKASNRKWKSWSVILTGSQLLLFRDPSWVVTLLSQSNASDGQVILPQTGNFYPDELLSVKDAIAVFDKSYTKYDNTFRFVMLDGRQLLLQASGNQELNEWISRINYASAFKSCGVRMRPAGLSGRDVELTGVAAATSHLHDMQHQRQANPSNIRSWDNNTPQELMGMLSGENSHSKTPPRRRVTIFGSREDMDLDVPVAPEVDGADQFKATFDQVKAELASGRWRSSADSLAPESTFESAGEKLNSRLPSRSQIIQTKIRDLEAKIAGSQSQLDSHMRLIRNIATLTPFQRATRDRLVTTVQAISKRVAHTRLDITRFTCYRDVLRNDLISEEQHWYQAKKIALRVATETLQSRSRENGIPKMTLSLHNDGSTSPLPRAALPTDRLDAPHLNDGNHRPAAHSTPP